MPDINEEMKLTSDYAIKAAKERFGQELDFSEQSIDKLENILDKIYWGFSNRPKDEGEGGLIFNTAAIWGSYLGEYMRLKRGGSWILKGSDRIVSIANIEFSPINWVYQKITSNPEYSVENYLLEANRKIYTSSIIRKQVQPLTEKISQPKRPISITPVKKPVTIDKRIIYTLAGIGGILLVMVACIIGYSMIKTSGIPMVGSIASATSTNTNVPIENTLVTATSSSTSTQYPTATLLPTYTPNPTITPRPSYTPSLTYTQLATLAPTDTQTPFVPTQTRTPRNTPTSIPVEPTNAPKPPTQPPPPTATEPPPVVLESCEINPSTVQAGFDVTITFIAHFSSPGYGFNSELYPNNFPGQRNCSGNDDDGDGVAWCDGSSGLLPDSTTVEVTFITSVGNCTTSYRSP